MYTIMIHMNELYLFIVDKVNEVPKYQSNGLLLKYGPNKPYNKIE